MIQEYNFYQNSDTNNQEEQFDKILAGKFTFVSPFWDNISASAKVKWHLIFIFFYTSDFRKNVNCSLFFAYMSNFIDFFSIYITGSIYVFAYNALFATVHFHTIHTYLSWHSVACLLISQLLLVL